MPKKKIELCEIDEEVATHRADDPDVWGLSDVARGRTALVPTTVYRVSGDSASGVAGRLLPSGEFLPVHTSRVGLFEMRCQDGGADDGQMMPRERVLPSGRVVINAPLPTDFWMETAWDGAMKEPEFEVTDEETGVTEVRQGRTKGQLLGNYEIRIAVDREREDKRTRGSVKPFSKMALPLAMPLSDQQKKTGSYPILPKKKEAA